jgi:hypothetical protein
MSWTEPVPSPPVIVPGSFNRSVGRREAASSRRGLAHAWKPHNHRIVPSRSISDASLTANIGPGDLATRRGPK